MVVQTKNYDRMLKLKDLHRQLSLNDPFVMYYLSFCNDCESDRNNKKYPCSGWISNFSFSFYLLLKPWEVITSGLYCLFRWDQEIKIKETTQVWNSWWTTRNWSVPLREETNINSNIWFWQFYCDCNKKRSHSCSREERNVAFFCFCLSCPEKTCEIIACHNCWKNIH